MVATAAKRLRSANVVLNGRHASTWLQCLVQAPMATGGRRLHTVFRVTARAFRQLREAARDARAVLHDRRTRQLALDHVIAEARAERVVLGDERGGW